MAGLGRMRHQVTVEVQHEAGTDERGQPIVEWIEARLWHCDIKQLTDRQREIVRQVYSDVTDEVIGNWFPDLSIRNRLRFGTRVLHIRNVDDIDNRHHRYRVLVAEDAV